MKIQNQKTSNYKDEIQKENFTRGKPEMTYITGGKTLLTLVLNIKMKKIHLCWLVVLDWDLRVCSC